MNNTAPAKWWQQKAVMITAIIAMAVVAIAALNSGKAETTAAVSQQTPEATAPVSPTPTPTPTPQAATQEPVAPAPAPVDVTVPNVVGMDYQSAQDLLRSQGLVVLPATDGTGANRIPLLDANWFVTGQDVAAGSTVPTGTGVTCTILKYTDS